MSMEEKLLRNRQTVTNFVLETEIVCELEYCID